MQIPIVSGLRELDPAPRRFLLFISFNVISWQCINGPGLVLFARHIDMPASWVGFLVSFLPMSMLLVVFTTRMVTRLGSKRLMMFAWTTRNIVACSVFTMPIAVALYGPRAAWFVLMGATLGFCVLRAIGAGGWLPWLHEVVPQQQRGVYFSSEVAVTQLLNVAVLLIQALILHGNPGTGRYLAIYGVGIATGIVSVYWMGRIPGGKGQVGAVRELSNFAAYRTALADKGYARLVALASFSFAVMALYGTAVVLYMRDALGIASNHIMYVMAAASAAVLFTVRQWGRYADRRGSSPACAVSVAGHSLFAAAAVAFIPGLGAFSQAGAAFLVIVTSIFGAAFGVAVHRAMLNRVNPDCRVGYTNLWSVSTAFSTAVSPIIAGLLIDHGGLWGYRVCFVASGLAGLLCAWMLPAVVGDTRGTDHAAETPAPSTLAQ